MYLTSQSERNKQLLVVVVVVVVVVFPNPCILQTCLCAFFAVLWLGTLSKFKEGLKEEKRL